VTKKGPLGEQTQLFLKQGFARINLTTAGEKHVSEDEHSFNQPCCSLDEMSMWAAENKPDRDGNTVMEIP
jgi:hypothetical protein